MSLSTNTFMVVPESITLVMINILYDPCKILMSMN